MKVPNWIGYAAWFILAIILGYTLHLHVATFRELMDFAWDNVR